MTPDFDFKWLHLSDLHTGAPDQSWLWPTLKHSLFEDLQKVHAAVGSWDVVVFSGDLTNRGARAEFDELDSILAELWKNFERLGFLPSLLVIPGNHDIVRPPADEPEVLLLNRWWEESSVREGVFGSEPGRYRTAIQSVFAEYSAWTARLSSRGIPTLPVNVGLLPGDLSTVVKIGPAQVGIVGLNSTWLQLGAGDYKGRLHVDPKQLLAVTDNDPVAWCKSNIFNILVTHQPVDWLHQDSQAYWDSDINPPGRFDVHLFGHMHEGRVSSTALGGSTARTSLQAASMFGLEYIGDKIATRVHGYALSRFRIAAGQQAFRLWPRTLRQIAGGMRKLGPDLTFDLDENNSCLVFQRYRNDQGANSPNETDAPEAASVRVLPISDSSGEVLRKIRYFLTAARAHLNVRRVEQRRCLASLADVRAAWLIAEWGMGTDGFVSSIQSQRDHAGRPTYRLDLSEYGGRDELFEAIRQSLGCSFERLCELIANVGPAYLLLDDFPVGNQPPDAALASERDFEDMINVILEYCPDLTIFVRARRVPPHHALPAVELKPLDEADVRVYISDHELGGPQVATTNVVSGLYRHTDGIPARVDTALKDLGIVSLSELIDNDSDLSGTRTHSGQAPPALSRAIHELANSTDPALRRSLDLLRALALFPQGEQLSRIKRFNGPHGFYTAHARELLDRALIDTSETQSIVVTQSDPAAKTLLVPRPIRECVRDDLGAASLKSLNRKAAELYFGPGWASGTIRPPPTYRFDTRYCSTADIANASTIVLRHARDAMSPENKRAFTAALRLATFYASALIKGDHFRSATTFCEDLLPLVPEVGFEANRAHLRYSFARGLRMVGEHKKAKAVSLEIIDFEFSKQIRQSLLVELAFSQKSLSENDDAIATAQRVLKIDRNSHSALQAQALIVELATKDITRQDKLVKLEGLCRRRKAFVVANNIAILRAREAKDEPEKVRQILGAVVQTTASTHDFYNDTRAIIELLELALKAGERLRVRPETS